MYDVKFMLLCLIVNDGNHVFRKKRELCKRNVLNNAKIYYWLIYGVTIPEASVANKILFMVT
jgi:hypothetical protein